jgi:hypothetical protein
MKYNRFHQRQVYGHAGVTQIDRLRKRWCELCDHGATVTVHHVAKLAQLGKPGPGQPAWAAVMAGKRRKTLIVCHPCHDYIHATPVANTA